MRKIKKISIGVLATLLFVVSMSSVYATVDSYYTYFGFYPQSVVEDTALYDELFFLGDTYLVDGIDNCYSYNDKYYMKYQTSLFQEERYFTTGNPIISNRVYFFLVEPILWNVYHLEDNLYYSNKILDYMPFEENSELEFRYDISSLQNYLNQKEKEIQVLNATSSGLLEFEISHSSIYQEAETSSFSLQLLDSATLNEVEDKKATPTDYALAKGLEVEVIENESYGAYWSAAYGAYTTTMMYVDEEGTFLYNKNVYETCGVRPMIRRASL